MKRTFRVTVRNGLGDECEVTVRARQRHTAFGAAILVARNRLPDEKPWRLIEIREDSSIETQEKRQE